jgi:hypothetical protein
VVADILRQRIMVAIGKGDLAHGVIFLRMVTPRQPLTTGSEVVSEVSA